MGIERLGPFDGRFVDFLCWKIPSVCANRRSWKFCQIDLRCVVVSMRIDTETDSADDNVQREGTSLPKLIRSRKVKKLGRPATTSLYKG